MKKKTTVDETALKSQQDCQTSTIFANNCLPEQGVKIFSGR